MAGYSKQQLDLFFTYRILPLLLKKKKESSAKDFNIKWCLCDFFYFFLFFYFIFFFFWFSL